MCPNAIGFGSCFQGMGERRRRRRRRRSSMMSKKVSY
jgi:hypothetical protein